MSSRRFPLEAQKRLAADLSRLLSRYRFIADASVIEFFTDDLWGGLPPSWQAALGGLSSPQLAVLFLGSQDPSAGDSFSRVWPLSLLAFRAAAHALAFPRSPGGRPDPLGDRRPEEFRENPCQSSKLHPLFRKHVKPKKQHEIRRLGQVVKELSRITGCSRVVDVGSGQGHLSRFLAFGLHLSVTAVEADSCMVRQAMKFDQELLKVLKKQRAQTLGAFSLQGPQHVAGWVDPGAPWTEFLHLLRCAEDSRTCDAAVNFSSREGLHTAAEARCQQPTVCLEQGEEEEEKGHEGRNQGCLPAALGHRSLAEEEGQLLLTGLHACGDLSVALLRLFARCPHVVGITSVACCYMKLTTEEMPASLGQDLWPPHLPQENGYPMSLWVSSLPGHQLSYKAREGACHALEDFVQRLKQESATLRTHCFRAMLETVIRRADPSKKCPGVQAINRAHLLTFEEYARLGLERLGLDPHVTLDSAALEAMLAQQQRVVAFFSLALVLAPLVETLLLLDRMIFLQEQGFHCELLPLFDPTLSPRNLVLVAAKTKSVLDLLARPSKSSHLTPVTRDVL